MCGVQCGSVARNLVLLKHKDFYYSYCSHDFLSSRLHRAGKCSIMLEHNAISLATTTSITNPSLGQNSKTKRSMQHFESTAKYLNSKTNKLGVADLMFCCKTPTYIERQRKREPSQQFESSMHAPESYVKVRVVQQGGPRGRDGRNDEWSGNEERERSRDLQHKKGNMTPLAPIFDLLDLLDLRRPERPMDEGLFSHKTWWMNGKYHQDHPEVSKISNSVALH
eukprot:sb/3469732/